MPVLVLARHAHAQPTGASDFERTLTPEGEAEATRAAASLSALDLDFLVASSATRTVQTGDAVRVAQARAGNDRPLHTDSTLYDANVEAWLEVLELIPLDARGAYVVGHMPTVAHVIEVLTGAPVSCFVPSSTAVFALPSWDVAVGDFPAPTTRDFTAAR